MTDPTVTSRSLAMAISTALHALLALERQGARNVRPALARLLAATSAAHKAAQSAVGGRPEVG